MILVAEDEPYIGENIRLLCADLGVGSDIVPTGKQALNMATSIYYRLIVLDLRLPDMNGVDIIKKIRRLPPPYGNAPILVESGEGPSVIRSALVAGANGLIEKPYALGLLKKRMVELMRPAARAAEGTL